MKRRIVRSKTSYVSFIKNQNNKTNVYTNVYDYTEFNEKSKIDSSVVLDRIFLDFDSHNEPMQNSFDDFKTVLGWAIENDYERTMFFSGNGFHMFLFGEITDDIRDIQYFQKEVVEFLESNISRKSTLDERVCQPTRLRRVPNTVNMKTENFLYCIPLLDSDLDSSLEEILEMARKPRHIPRELAGKTKVSWPHAPDLMEVEGEVSVPKAVGNLPMLPCLHNAIMVENPAHEARYYLVQWFRDLLTGRTNILSRSEQEKILDAIVDEIEHIVTNTDEIWLDWNREKTKQHSSFSVYKNMKTPGCLTQLIPKGYCIGKCWRYPDFVGGKQNGGKENETDNVN